MFLKSIEVKDIYGEPVILGGEEIVRAYEKVIQDFMETRFFWLFHDTHEKFDKENIKMCARLAAKKVTSVINFSANPRGRTTKFEKDIYSKFKFDNFDLFGE